MKSFIIKAYYEDRKNKIELYNLITFRGCCSRK
jgi:hypothetical protein